MASMGTNYTKRIYRVLVPIAVLRPNPPRLVLYFWHRGKKTSLML